jgi:hypothetical protein
MYENNFWNMAYKIKFIHVYVMKAYGGIRGVNPRISVLGSRWSYDGQLHAPSILPPVTAPFYP